MKAATKDYVSTANPCKVCRPLGACLAYRGVEGAIPYLHGSQGCATYIRRYLIGHFREPVDIASSSLGETEAVYGGGASLVQGLHNAADKYSAGIIGLATTCLTEVQGEDLRPGLNKYASESNTPVVHASTPSFNGTHIDGFHDAVNAMVSQLAFDATPHEAFNLLPGMVSPADLRHLREICEMFQAPVTMLPDYSESMDGPVLDEAVAIPTGGTPVADIRKMAGAKATLELGRTLAEKGSAGQILAERSEVQLWRTGFPIGLRETDAFLARMEEISGRETPASLKLDRGRLVDTLIDAHKVLRGRRVAVQGDEDLVIGLVSFLTEMGADVVLVVSGGSSNKLDSEISRVCASLREVSPRTIQGGDFRDFEEAADALKAEGKPLELVLGTSKAYRLCRQWDIPLIRVGFPVHDRFGSQRILHLGYEGALRLADEVANALIETRQDDNTVGYGYW
jgi:nitrogenase molybdenum-iron protein NifN